MKIIEPSATILETELAGLSVCQRIDRLASVCYQRPPRPTEEEAEKFCRNLIERGHLPALEMAVVHLAVDVDQDTPDSKFLSYSVLVDSDEVLVSGSIRAFMEADEIQDAANFLSLEYPMFFRCNPVEGEPVRFATPDEIPWQHKHVAVRVICSRAVSHRLVRHRPCSFLQESTRYCRYDDGVTFIRPEWPAAGGWLLQEVFETDCKASEDAYKVRRAYGCAPQQASGALNHDVKTELIIYASLPEWKHIFAMRCAKAADPEIRRIMVPLREQFETEYPEMWEGK